jgi:hypothetical protein
MNGMLQMTYQEMGLGRLYAKVPQQTWGGGNEYTGLQQKSPPKHDTTEQSMYVRRSAGNTVDKKVFKMGTLGYLHKLQDIH